MEQDQTVGKKKDGTRPNSWKRMEQDQTVGKGIKGRNKTKQLEKGKKDGTRPNKMDGKI